MSRVVLSALRAGPIRSDEWSATTRNALRVGIYNLREAGYGIDTVPLGRTGQASRLSEYRLRYEPDMVPNEPLQTIPRPA